MGEILVKSLVFLSFFAFLWCERFRSASRNEINDLSHLAAKCNGYLQKCCLENKTVCLELHKECKDLKFTQQILCKLYCLKERSTLVVDLIWKKKNFAVCKCVDAPKLKTKHSNYQYVLEFMALRSSDIWWQSRFKRLQTKMDPSLLREREAFKKRAIATPVVENRKKKDGQGDGPPPKRKSKPSSQSKSAPKPPTDPFSYKTMQGSSQYKFGVLAKIVKHMKQRHQDGDTHPLSFDEILDETNQLDLGPGMKRWLLTEALNSNPKIVVSPEGKYSFKPPYNIRDKKGLLRLLDNHDQRGLGGILQEDVQESLPNTEKCIKLLGDQITFVNRPMDKKRILFFNDKSIQFVIDDEFQKLWRSVAVDGIDENKIEEYLEKQGITSMQDQGPKKMTPMQKRKKGGQKKNRNFKRHNDHMGDILEDYTDK